MLTMQYGETETERCLKPSDAVRCALKLLLLLMRGMRRMVGCDAVNSAVQQTFNHCIAVFEGTQWRVHLGECVVSVDRFFRKNEMMRRDLAGDMQPTLSRRPYMIQGLLRGYMGHVQMRLIKVQFAEQCD